MTKHCPAKLTQPKLRIRGYPQLADNETRQQENDGCAPAIRKLCTCSAWLCDTVIETVKLLRRKASTDSNAFHFNQNWKVLSLYVSRPPSYGVLKRTTFSVKPKQNGKSTGYLYLNKLCTQTFRVLLFATTDFYECFNFLSHVCEEVVFILFFLSFPFNFEREIGARPARTNSLTFDRCVVQPMWSS